MKILYFFSIFVGHFCPPGPPGSGSAIWMRIRIQQPKLIRIRIRNPDKDPQQIIKKCRNIMFWSAWFSLLRVEGFFCSLDVLQWRPWDKIIAISEKNFFVFSISFNLSDLKFFVITSLDPDPHWLGISSWTLPASFPDYFDGKGKFSRLFLWEGKFCVFRGKLLDAAIWNYEGYSVNLQTSF